jgi:hypothetical protein
METLNEYEVDLWEDEIERDETGRVVHHPLNSRYYVIDREDTASYGLLTFGGHDLDKSPILEDVKVFYLEFKGGPEEIDDREGWADPLRVEVLKRLTDTNRCWYLSMIDGAFEVIGDTIKKLTGTLLKQVEVRSEIPFGYGHGFIPRLFFEVPNRYLSEVVRYFWSEALPVDPIEGYNIAVGKIEVLAQWDARPRNDQLFRDVIDQTFINFYTFPAEHCDFVFVTNKLTCAELANLIGLEELQERAKEMSREKKR